MNRRQLLLGTAAASTAATLPNLLPGILRPAMAQGSEITIGVIYPLSGASAQVGVDAKHALETAAAIVNDDLDLDLIGAKGAGIAGLGGAKIRLVFADHQADPQKGRAEAERLITQEKVCAIVGAFHSSVSATASVTCERYGVPYVAADSSSPSLHRRGLRFFFRPAAHDEMFSAAMFDFLDAEKKRGQTIETVGLFYEDTIFGSDSSNVQRTLAGQRGYKVVADVKYRASSPTLSTEVQTLKSANPDVLLPSSYTTDAILLMKTMAELGFKPKNMVAQAAGFAEKATFDTVGGQLKGLISRASFSLDLTAKRPSVGVVNEMFKKRSGKDLNDNSSRQLMALLVLAEALDRAKSTDGQAIRAALAATDIAGDKTIMPWSKVKFGEDGQNTFADPVLLQYTGSAFTTVFPESAAVAPAIWPMNG